MSGPCWRWSGWRCAAAGRLVVGAAASPGLTGLLARLAADELDTVDEIHVAFHGTGGPACARQHHAALGSLSRVWYDGTWQERPGGTGRELCWFPDPVGAHDCYRAALPDPLLLHRAFPEATRVTARMTATRRDRLTARLPMLRPPHPEALEGSVRVEVRGPAAEARGAVLLGVAAPLGTVAGAVAAAVATAAGRRARCRRGWWCWGSAAADPSLLPRRRRGRHRRPPLRRHRQQTSW